MSSKQTYISGFSSFIATDPRDDRWKMRGGCSKEQGRLPLTIKPPSIFLKAHALHPDGALVVQNT